MTTPDLEKQAIKAAIRGNWREAIRTNQKILKQDGQNIAALNRLGRAFWETNSLKRAKEIYQKVLEIDRYNSIALRNLKRLTYSRQKTGKEAPEPKKPTPGGVFLEEPGKTKITKLVRLADPIILSESDNGDPVKLEPKKRIISIVSENGTYLGSLPEDLSQRLIRLIKGGNRYRAFIKAVDRQHLEILIHEAFRAPRLKNIPSFTPGGTSYIPFLSPDVIHQEKPEMTPTGEEEETKED